MLHFGLASADSIPLTPLKADAGQHHKPQAGWLLRTLPCLVPAAPFGPEQTLQVVVGQD